MEGAGGTVPTSVLHYCWAAQGQAATRYWGTIRPKQTVRAFLASLQWHHGGHCHNLGCLGAEPRRIGAEPAPLLWGQPDLGLAVAQPQGDSLARTARQLDEGLSVLAVYQRTAIGATKDRQSHVT